MSYGIKIPPKHKVAHKKFKPPKPEEDRTFRRLVSLYAAQSHMIKHGETLTRRRSISRKLAALPEEMKQRILSQPMALQQDCVAELQAEHVKQQHTQVMDAWKQKVKAWRGPVRNVCAFIRNPSPAKMCVLDCDGVLESNPSKIQSRLMHTWSEIETWPTEVSEQAALIALEDKYSFLLPRLGV